MRKDMSKGVVLGFLLCLAMVVWAGSAIAESEEERTAKLVEGAKKEGEIVYYGSMDIQDIDTLTKKFREKYPFIKIAITRAGSDKLLTRIMAEDQAKRYFVDVIEIGGIKPVLLKKKGILAKYTAPSWKMFPDGFKDTEGYWTSIVVNPTIIAYNTNFVSAKDAPKTYEDLLDPKWKSKMLMPSNSVYWFSYMLKMMGEEKGLDYMRRLARQDIQLRPGRTLNVQLVAAGERSIGIGVFNYRVEEIKSKGGHIDWVALEPVVAELNGPAVAAHAPHPNAARLLVDFYLSKEGQEIAARNYRIPSRIDVDPLLPRLKLKGIKFLPYDPSIADDWQKNSVLFRNVFTVSK